MILQSILTFKIDKKITRKIALKNTIQFKNTKIIHCLKIYLKQVLTLQFLK